MKFKALRTKQEPKQFIHLMNLNDCWEIEYGTLPYPLPISVTLEKIIELVNEDRNVDIDFNKYELIEFEMFEKNAINADIQNKLTSFSNLIALLKLYFDENDLSSKEKLLPYIKKEINKSNKIIKYLSNLL